MTISHADRVDQTIEALEGDVTQLNGDGISAIDGWRGVLERNNSEGWQSLIEKLDQLKQELESGKLNGGRIGKLLTQLGEETTQAAEQADDEWRDRISRLGSLLTKAGGKLSK